MIEMIAKLLSVLNSETEPGQISLGFCFSMVIGFTPFLCLHNILIMLLVLTLRINISAFVLGWPVFSGIAYLFDPMFHTIGYTILTASALNALWTAFYNITFFHLENFNNSIAMGSLFISLVLFVPFYFLFNYLIRKYRERFLKWIEKTKVVQILKSTKFYSVYQAIAG